MTQRLSFFIFIFIFSHLAFSQGAQALFKKVDEYQFTNAPKAFEYLQQIEKLYPQLPDSLKGK